MSKISAGLLLYRVIGQNIEVLLVHPGGPFWAKKDAGTWSIPKGEVDDGEDLLVAAKREFAEELGCTIEGQFIALGSAKQPSGKVVHAWAMRGEFNCDQLRSNHFEMEWPRGSGKTRSFPEVDRAEWFDLQIARIRILKGQSVFLDRLSGLVHTES